MSLYSLYVEFVSLGLFTAACPSRSSTAMAAERPEYSTKPQKGKGELFQRRPTQQRQAKKRHFSVDKRRRV